MPAVGRFVPFAAACTILAGVGGVRADGLLGPSATKPAAPPSADTLAPVTPLAPGSPTALVKPFYEHFGLELDPAQRGNFIDPARKVLDDNEALRKSGQGDCLDPNMALDNAAADKAQISASLKTLEAVNGDQAKVVVAFVEDGKPHRLEWKLRKLDGTWKIADLLSVTGEWELSQYQCE
jgi:hypothetical protein